MLLKSSPFTYFIAEVEKEMCFEKVLCKTQSDLDRIDGAGLPGKVVIRVSFEHI